MIKNALKEEREEVEEIVEVWVVRWTLQTIQLELTWRNYQRRK